MLFRLESSDKGTATHCGVLEFTAEEGSCFIPFWMMQNLLIEEGAVISITNISLPKATFVKLQPQHVDFLEITNPRAVLEHALRNFSCVTKGDVICVPYNSKNYHFELKEVKPKDAVCIIETDCNVDFDAPVGYKEPERTVVPSGPGSASALDSNSLASSLANIPKQTAYAGSNRNSACPSPALSSMSGASGSLAKGDNKDEEQVSGTRIVDGKIVRVEDVHMNSQTSGVVESDGIMMAERTGGTGVQPNAAIAVQAPQVDYWAINAGDGARMDGKVPSVLKDKNGNEIDVSKLRAEAAARRLERMNAEQMMPRAATGITVAGKTVPIEENNSMKPPAAPISKRKSRIGQKYSKLKQGGAAFGGAAKKL